MRKNLVRRAIVLVVCLAFLGITASSALAAKPARSNLRSTFMKQYTFLVSLLPALGDIFGKGKPGNGKGDGTGSSGIVRPTDDIPDVKPPR